MNNHWLTKKMIDRLINNFDFDKVRHAMKVLDLKWHTDELEEEARNLLEKVAKDEGWGWIGVDIGYGFTAQKLPNGELVLHFSLELNQSGV